MCLSSNEPGGPRRCSDYMRNVENKVVSAHNALEFLKQKQQVLENAKAQVEKIDNMSKENLTEQDKTDYERLYQVVAKQVRELEAEIPQLQADANKLQAAAQNAMAKHNEEVERQKRMQDAPPAERQDIIDDSRPVATMSAREFEKFEPTIKPGTEYYVRTRSVPLRLEDGTVHPYLTVVEKDIQFPQDEWTEALKEKHPRQFAERENSDEWRAPIQTVMQSAFAVSDGGRRYVSKQQSTEENPSTGDRIRMQVYNKDHVAPQLLTEPPEDLKSFHAFAVKFPGDSAFSHKIRTLARQDRISPADASLFASAMTQWRMYADSKGSKPASSQQTSSSKPHSAPKNNGPRRNEFVGEVNGQIEDTKMTVRAANDYDSTFDPGEKITMLIAQDSEGRTYKWVSSKKLDVSPGDVISLSGTVKEHAEYNKIKQTILTRCHMDILQKKASV